jgi:outer membrane protein assembly factor BamC
LGDLRVERQGQQRWLVSPQTPEQLWPQLKAYWAQRGATLVVDDAKTGILETDWAENRDKAPKDFIRSTLGQLFSNVFDSGFRDRYRMRVERTVSGSEVYVSHRGLEEVYTDGRKESTVWRGRPNDPQLEAEVLASLMVSLGTKPEAAKTTVAAAPEVPAKVSTPAAVAAAADANQATSLVVDDPFDRAWRRVGLALDRGGFTVEDRDRASGLYYVRYIDPKSVDKDDPSWWSRLFGDGKDPKAALRYRILLKAAGDKTNLSVQTPAGAPDAGENAKRIIGLLSNGLR